MRVKTPAGVEPIEALGFPGVIAFTTTRARGDFNLVGEQPAGVVVARWLAVQEELGVPRMAYGKQVHGRRVVAHHDAWSGWLRVTDTDGHVSLTAGTALAVTLADCVPVFLAHPNGIVALLHAGWRGVAGGIVDEAAAELERHGAAFGACHAHLGPAICGKCYEVGPEVIESVRGERVDGPAKLDLRSVLGAQLAAHGISRVSVSRWCTRCHNERFFSHRVGDMGRHIAVVARIA